MFIHIGGESTISDKYIVGIFDMESLTVDSDEAIDFIRQAEEAGRVEIVSSEIPRSFVVTMDRVYLTPISVATLRRRIEKAFSWND
ncbi:MAG: extracellular matrix regulator RemB [Saccharofermentanales bacterium]|jgi:hypothetical protein